MAQVVNNLDSSSFFGISPAKAKSDLDMTTFMRLLTVQLTNQNPLEPMNDRDFFAQMAQLGTVQGIDQMKGSLQLTQASALMGKTVTGDGSLSAGGPLMSITGKVIRLTSSNGTYYLGLQQADGTIANVKLTNVKQVTE